MEGNPSGTVVLLVANTTPVPSVFFALGAKGKPAEKVADEAVEQLEQYLQVEPAGIDSHSADQVLLPLALSEDPSQFRVATITEHLLTNVGTVGQDRKSTRLNSSHIQKSRMPSSA